ncbi:MAG: hypothetical protein ACRD2L_00315, partial [Terriglobia bacterium]
STPSADVPPLTPEQREVARKLQIAEEDYARSAMADQRAMEKLLGKAERFARLLGQMLERTAPAATIESVALNTWEDQFEILIQINGHVFPVNISEDIVDDLFERGSEEAEQRLARILEVALQSRVS